MASVMGDHSPYTHSSLGATAVQIAGPAKVVTQHHRQGYGICSLFIFIPK